MTVEFFVLFFDKIGKKAPIAMESLSNLKVGIEIAHALIIQNLNT